MAIVAVTLVTWVSAPVMAQDAAEVSLLPYKGNRAVLKISNPGQEDTFSLTIKNATGEVLFQEKITAATFEKVFDFSVAGNGEYVFDLNHAGDLIRNVVKVSEEGIAMEGLGEEQASHYAFSKDITKTDNGMLVKFQNQLEEPMTLKIFDAEEGTLLYQETDIQSTDFVKSYDFSQLKKGMYSMSITGDSYSYYYDLDLRR